MFDAGNSLKIQHYLSNQNLDSDTLNFINSMKFSNLYTSEQYNNISNMVNTYKKLNEENKINPSYEVSNAMKELNEDIFYATGQDANTIKLSDLQTTLKLDDAMLETNLRSKNDLFVEIDYDDYSSNSNYVKCHITSHNTPGAYGIASNARMIVTNDGTIITTKNAMYVK